MKNNNRKNEANPLFVWTHNGQFHADEVSAVALLKIFHSSQIVVIRAATPPEHYDIAVDIGRQFDGVTKFDHHHNKDLEAACVLIGNWLVEQKYLDAEIWTCLYSSIFKYISQVDRGIIRGGGEKHSINALIRNFNTGISDNTDDTTDNAFDGALDVMHEILSAAYYNTYQMLKQDKNWEKFKRKEGVVEMTDKCRRWKGFAKSEGVKFAVSVSDRDDTQGALTTIDSKEYPILSHPKQTFLHNDRFFAAYETYTDALKHARDLVKYYDNVRKTK